MTSAPIESPEAIRFDLGDFYRISARLLLLVGLLFALIIPHYFAHWVLGRSHIPRIFLAKAARIIGARVRVHGNAPRANAFIISNHISWLDILIIGGVCGSSFIGKYELSTTPFISWLCGINRTVYVNRSDRMGISVQIDQVRNALESGRPLTIFPEGTTHDGTALLPFKTSMMRALEPVPEGLSIVPTFITYGQNSAELCWVGDESGITNALRILARPGSFAVDLHILPRVIPRQDADRKAICELAHTAISAAFDQAPSA